MTPSSAPLLLVMGATGRVGRLLVAILVERGYAVRAMVRDYAAACAILPNSVDVVLGGLQFAPDIECAVKDVDGVIFVASAGAFVDGEPQLVDFEGVQRTAESAMRAGVTYFLLLSSASVTHPEHPHNCTFNSVLKWKYRGEQALRARTLPYTIVRSLGLRDRPAQQHGIRIVQGDRLAFGEDIARADVASFLAALTETRFPMVDRERADTLIAIGVESPSLWGATIEIYNDSSVPAGTATSRMPTLAADAIPDRARAA